MQTNRQTDKQTTVKQNLPALTAEVKNWSLLSLLINMHRDVIAGDSAAATWHQLHYVHSRDGPEMVSATDGRRDSDAPLDGHWVHRRAVLRVVRIMKTLTTPLSDGTKAVRVDFPSRRPVHLLLLFLAVCLRRQLNEPLVKTLLSPSSFNTVVKDDCKKFSSFSWYRVRIQSVNLWYQYL